MPEVLQLIHGIFALAQPARRREALAEFADLVGARAIVPLVRDPELDTFLPAPEIGGPLAGGPGWRSLLAACAEPGTYHGAVAARRGEAEVPALACSTGQAALVILASEVPTELINEIARALPALGATWRTEIEVRALNGTLQAALGTARDTQVMAEALDRTRDELESKARSLFNACTRAEEASRVKDEFLAVLGHELRNPLAPIVTALELMRLEGKPTREQIIIERHVTQMRRMVDDLLDIARTTRAD